jgi:putative transposase
MGFEEAQLRAEPRAVAVKHPAWGWRKARWHLLAQPDWYGTALNRKRIRRFWRDEGLTCKLRARKKGRTGPGDQKRLTAEYTMHVVSFDFQSEVTSCGRHIRFFFRLDEYTRTVLAHRRRRYRIHRPGITLAERLHRILQRPIQEGTTLRRSHGHHGRSQVFGRGMESYLQS